MESFTLDFLDRADKENGVDRHANVYHRGPEDPEVVFKSPLTMGKEEEAKMCSFALRRFDDMMDERGEYEIDNPQPDESGRFEYLQAAWASKRELYDRIYNQDVTWRQMYGGIFNETNIHLPITELFVGREINRAIGFFFETDPWFAARPRRPLGDQAMGAEMHEFYLRYKADKSKLRDVMKAAVKRSFINGEAVVKETYQRKARVSEELETVCVENGELVLTEDGEPIYLADKWTTLINEEGQYIDLEGDVLVYDSKAEGGIGVVAPENFATSGLEMVKQVDAAYKLEKEEETVVRAPTKTLNFEERLIKVEDVEYEGADADLVYWKDFYCPLNARSVQEADVICYVYDDTISRVVQRYMNETEGSAANDPAFLEMIQEMASDTNNTKSHDGRRGASGNRHNEGGNTVNGESTIKIGEFWLSLPRDDGEIYEVMLIMDLERKKPIYYDYTARVTAHKRRPFVVIAPQPVENRWYGKSRVGTFWALQEFMDLLMNRAYIAQTSSGRLDAINPEAFIETKNDPYIDLNRMEYLTIDPEYRDEIQNAIFTHHFQDVNSDDAIKLKQIAGQYLTNLSSSPNASTSDMQNLDHTKLATGIRHMELDSQENFAPLIGNLLSGIEECVELFTIITVRYLTEDEEFEYFENGEQKFELMRAVEVEDIDYKIKIELTKYRSEQQLAQAQLVKEAAIEFVNLPYLAQQQLKPLYLTIAKSAQISDPETIFTPIDLMGGAAPQPGAMDPELAQQALPQPQQTDVNF